MRVLSADWLIPVEGPPLERGAVAIGEDGRIAAVGTVDELGEGEAFPEAAILPGFVDAHTHLEYAGYAGFGDGLPFSGWIQVHVQRKRLLDREDMLDLARLGAAACLRAGVTTVGDASFSGAAAEACAETGLRAIVHLEVFGDADEGMERFAGLRAAAEHAFSDEVRPGVSPHAPYTCTPELYEACAALRLPVSTHLAESAAERAWVTAGEGDWAAFADLLAPPLETTAIRALAERGLLGPHVVAAHCVDVDEEEIGLLADTGTAVAHCPRSNALLGCGTAPLAALREAGVTVCIAGDSPASTPGIDPFDEMRAAIMAARAREQRPDALSAADALELATLGGARALRLDAETGSLVRGKRADLVVVSMKESHHLPWEDPVKGVVLGGSPDRVVATLVAGVDRYRQDSKEGTTRWRATTRAARRARSRMLP